nr:hypothetical protein [Enterovibrio nigricans]
MASVRCFSSVVHTIGQVNDEYAITARLGGVVGITFGTALDVVSGLAKGIEYALLAAQRMFYGIGIAALDLMDIEFISDMLGVTAVGDAKSGLQVKLEGVVTQMKEVEKQGDILAKRIVTNFSGNLDQILSGETRDSSDFNIERPEASKSKVKTKDKVDPNDSKSYLAALSLEIEKTDALAAARQRLEWISGGVAVAQDALATSYSEGAAGELEQVNEALAVFENKHKMMIEFNEEYQDLVLAQGELEKKVADEVAEHKYNTMIGNLAMLSSVLDQDSNAYKAIATTQAIADTFAGANSALNPAKGSPDAMLSSTQRMINAGVIVTTGIANVSNIMAAKDGASMVGVPHYNSGTSFVDGSGTSKSDDVPAMLSRGESVLTASASQALGRGNIDAMNAGHGMSMGGGSQQINAGITINGNVDQNTLNELNSMQEKQVKMIARTMADKAIKQQKKPGGLLR